ncbi:pentapeptide repeat-containing protein [Planktothrix mougeotii]|uniref:Pentapeptide repeat-containing protein n=1 Tax=Planktothrix mougeotii LEGE 06226 TaxID=1828728 RepID=A0ABR9UH05_9CYAN|nr:pentapeptide repeat-containing protein [Planktothrix mougeotii]MBE9145742.1 pentapeptide repeat-containing protein [Planktothrix mougeotii LEGE 06226]
MTMEPNSSSSHSQGVQENPESLNGGVLQPHDPPPTEEIQLNSGESWEIETRNSVLEDHPSHFSGSVLVLSAMALMILGLGIDNITLGYVSAVATLAISLRLLWSGWGKVWTTLIPASWRSLIIACFGILGSLIGLVIFSNANTENEVSNITINWDAIGALGDLGGALGQILIAILAVYVAWRQYIISRDLTIQQNRITQQQTIDAYFQGVSDLALGEQGLLEDWPQERVIAEGRTSAIIKSVDAEGKAKILRFLSQAKLITPLQRDRHLGRPMLDGNGNYAEDRDHGVRVIDLGAMLAGADLSQTDLRRTDLSDANLVKANLTGCDLVRTNLARSILYEANLSYTNLRAVRFFYGSPETASPRSKTLIPNFTTGEHTGAVVENADFTGVENLSEESRYYCCAWCGSKSRKTIPGGCEGIPNKLDR